MDLKEIDYMYMRQFHFFTAWYHMRGLAHSVQYPDFDERLQT